MKKYMIAFILCGLIVTFAGCNNQENNDISVESTGLDSSSVALTTISTVGTETDTSEESSLSDATIVTTEKEKIPEVTTNTTEVLAIPKIESTQVPSVNIATPPKTSPVKIEETAPPTKPIITTPVEPIIPPPPPSQTEISVVTTITSKPQKVLNEAFKQELTEYIQDYCKETGLVYRDDGNTPDNSSWDIPARTVGCNSNNDIKEYVRSRARIILINYGEGTVINLYFEDDWEAPGEWRIYVLF